MKRFIIVLLILIFCIWIGTEIKTGSGHLLITYHQLALQVPLWLSLLGLIALFMLFYVFIRCISYVATLPRRWRAWLQQNQQRKETAINAQVLFTKIYQKPRDWAGILEAIPQLEKKDWLSKQQLQSLVQESYENLLTKALHAADFITFDSLWKRLSRPLKEDARFINLYVQALIKRHEDTKAELLITKQLKKQWFSPLVQSYSLIKNANTTRQLSLAEKWLKSHPDDPHLLLNLGRLCKREKLWGKARDYLESSLVQDPYNAETYQELGELFEALGEPIQALPCFKKALILNKNTDISG